MNRLPVFAIYNRKGKDKVTTIINYDHNMFIEQDKVTTIVNYDRNMFIGQAAGAILINYVFIVQATGSTVVNYDRNMFIGQATEGSKGRKTHFVGLRRNWRRNI